MRIEGVEVTVAALSLRAPVRSAGLSHSDKTTLFFRIVTDETSGWGECCAYPDARLPDPTVHDVEPAVVDEVVARFLQGCIEGQVPPAAAVLEICGGEGTVTEQSVAAALEMAVLDAELRSTSRSLASLLGVERREVETGALVGIPHGRDLGALIESVAAALDAGARRIRLKIEPGWDHQPIAAVREHFADAVLQADANGSFEPSSSSSLCGLDSYQLRCLEQPFAADDLGAHRALADVMVTPIALDESLWSLAKVRQAIGAGSCRVACLKPGRLGGVFATLAAAEMCAQAGIDCFVGGFFESGLGRSVNATLAGRDEFGWPGDLGSPDRYLVASPFSYLVERRGTVQLSDAPGLGAELRPDIFDRQRIHARWIPY